jgi:hypothetical protein
LKIKTVCSSVKLLFPIAKRTGDFTARLAQEKCPGRKAAFSIESNDNVGNLLNNEKTILIG